MIKPRLRRAGNKGGERRRVNWWRLVVYGVLPGLALLLAMGAGVLKGKDSSLRDVELARIESVRAAKDSTIALLSFRPGTLEKDVEAARNRLTGGFRNSYTQATRDKLIPNAKERQISATAGVSGAAAVSATQDHAVVLVFADQTVTVGTAPPFEAFWSHKVTLDKVAGRWLISGFDPV